MVASLRARALGWCIGESPGLRRFEPLLLEDLFFLIHFYLQAVQIHLANVVKLLEA
jgi:hypothetical protein